jgi:hypothetical protein
MLALDNPRWAELKNGYRVAYDARPLVRRFASGDDPDGCWDEIWEELHHQGDVDTASYAVLPHLVRMSREQQRDWNIYSYAATLSLEAGREPNPAIPEYIEPGFSESMGELFELAIADLRLGVPPITVRCILGFLAAHERAPELARAIVDIDLFEKYGERVLEAEQNGGN